MLDQFYMEVISLKNKLKKELLWVTKLMMPIKKHLKAN